MSVALAPGRGQLRVGQISVRCLGKSTVAKRGKGEIVAQLGGRTISFGATSVISGPSVHQTKRNLLLQLDRFRFIRFKPLQLLFFRVPE